MVAAIGGLIAAGSAIASWLQQRRAQKKQNQANREMAQFEFDKNVEMMNMVNQYNSPVEQMKRLNEGGLNPNLVYGGGNVTGNSSEMAKYNAPTQTFAAGAVSPFGNLTDTLDKYQEIRMQNAQIDNLNAQRELTNEKESMQSFENAFNQEYRPIRQNRLEIANQYESDRQLLTTRKLQRENEMMPHYGELAKFQLEKMGIDNKKKAAEMNKTIQSMKKLGLETQYQKMKNEWYTTQMFGKMGIDALNAITGGWAKMAGKGFKTFDPTKASAGKINPQNAKRAFDETTRNISRFKH